MDREVSDNYRCWSLTFHRCGDGPWSVRVHRDLPGTGGNNASWEDVAPSIGEAYASARGWIDAEYAIASQGLWSELVESGAVSAGMAG